VGGVLEASTLTRTGMPAQPIAASGPDTGRDIPMDSLHPELALRSGKQPAVRLLTALNASWESVRVSVDDGRVDS
jgi:hypothetical protein